MDTVTETVSIIIPTRNRATVLKRCLEALAQQHRNDYWCQLIVVDDCSTDGTDAVVRDYTLTSQISIELVRHSRALGANAARNLGLGKATAEIIIFLDDDVLVTPNWLKTLIHGLRGSRCPVVSGPLKLLLEGQVPGRHGIEVRTLLSEVAQAPLGFKGEIVPVSGNMAAFRWVFDRARFDESVRPPMEETDWLMRAGVSAGFVPEAWVWHYKPTEELRPRRLLRGAWSRGGEGGWWIRDRLGMPLVKRLPLAARSLQTCARAIGHAALHRCWGGAVVAAGELSKAASLLGLTNRGPRLPRSWR